MKGDLIGYSGRYAKMHAMVVTANGSVVPMAAYTVLAN